MMLFTTELVSIYSIIPLDNVKGTENIIPFLAIIKHWI
jgi:hypothetical protein